jgi:hypothetical protein
MVVDLERVNELAPDKVRTWIVEGDIDFLMQAYRDHLECLREDRLLLPSSLCRRPTTTPIIIIYMVCPLDHCP